MAHIINIAAQVIVAGFCKRQPSSSDDDKDDDEGNDKDKDEGPGVGVAQMNSKDDVDTDDTGETSSWTLNHNDGDNDEEEVTDYSLPAIEKGSKEEKESIDVIAKFAKKIWFLAKAKAVFKEVCIAHKVEWPHNIRQDLKMQWNSMGDMVEDVDHTLPAIISAQQDPRLNILCTQRLHKADHNHIKGLILLFKAFKIVTDVLSHGNVPMLTDIIVHFDLLDFTYSKMCED
ncbi:hypothetical protein FRC10_005590, partial [Ceratobasidium sp. 414]